MPNAIGLCGTEEEQCIIMPYCGERYCEAHKAKVVPLTVTEHRWQELKNLMQVKSKSSVWRYHMARKLIGEMRK